MPIPPLRSIRLRVTVWILTFFVTGFGLVQASAQDRPADATNVSREVLRDPTTIAPMIISFELRQLDWKSSQPFFQQGWFEHNADFTVSGLSNDVPVSYADGRRRNLELALVELPIALAHNTASYAIEQRLVSRYPDRKGLWHALGWVERVAFTSYRASLVASHYRQWQQNDQLAKQLGYR